MVVVGICAIGSLSACSLPGAQPGQSWAAGVSSADVSRLSGAIGDTIAASLPRAASTLVVRPAGGPAGGESGQIITATLRERGFALAPDKGEYPGGHVVTYNIAPVEQQSVLLRLDVDQAEMTCLFGRDVGGNLSGAGSCSVRNSAALTLAARADLAPAAIAAGPMPASLTSPTPLAPQPTPADQPRSVVTAGDDRERDGVSPSRAEAPASVRAALSRASAMAHTRQTAARSSAAMKPATARVAENEARPRPVVTAAAALPTTAASGSSTPTSLTASTPAAKVGETASPEPVKSVAANVAVPATPAVSTAPGAAKVTAEPIAPVAQPAPEPRWSLRAGDLVGATLKTWGRTAGWTVLWNAPLDWPTPTGTEFTGSFLKVAEAMITALRADGADIRAIAYTPNTTLVVSAGSDVQHGGQH
ncbi:MAG: TcpQ domain-containing protein [Acetobacteraceae bacterium]|nr:TcpQ domain-containing protein [Acetobacteraceae bacterium]